MIEIRNKENCCGCQACFQKCPVHAISMGVDEEGFWYPHINLESCIDCGICERVCPQVKQYNTSEPTEIWGCYRKNLSKRMKSASGGVFAALAETVLKCGGVVFGAAFNDEWELKHRYVEKADGLEYLLGSKYVQSDIDNTYVQAKEFLRSGRVVLFSGTPCQIQGLKKYLDRDYDNLLTVDLICHGVPSPEVWSDYITEIARGSKLIAFSPRDKTKGINNAPLVFSFDNGRIIKQLYDRNPYMRGFNQSLYLRPSCYACKFKGINRCSDLTIGDFWGYDSYFPSFGDHYGISVAMVHNEKGKRWFNAIEDEFEMIAAKVEQILPQNPSLIKTVPRQPERDVFFDRWKQQGVSRTVKQILRLTLRQRVDKALKPVKYYIWLVKRKLRK